MRKPAAIALIAASFVAGCAGGSGPGSSSRSQSAKPEPNTWRVIAKSPIRPGYGHSAVWTGQEMIVWGGSEQDKNTLESKPVRDGAAYDPEVDSWRRIPKAPVAGGYGFSVVWTGEEMIVWGDPRRGRRSRGNIGAAFDPSTDEWRRIASVPLPGRAGHLAVWTGEEMVVWGGYLTASKRERYDGNGAAYDPATDVWRMLPRAPLPAGYSAMGAWTGEEVIVMASPMGIKASDYPKFAEAAAYDPATDSWRELPRPPHVSYVEPPAAFLEDELILLSLGGDVEDDDGNGRDRTYDTGGILDVSEEKWRPHADTKLYVNQRWEQIALADEVVIDGLAYDPDEDAWRKLPKFPLGNREFPVRVWTGSELIVWGGAKLHTGNVIVDPPPPRNTGAAYAPPR